MSNNPARRMKRLHQQHSPQVPNMGGRSSNPNGVHAALQAQQSGQPLINVAAPLQLDALISLAAAVCPGPAAEAVDRACEIVSQATLAVMTGKVQRRIQELMEAEKKKQEAANPQPESPILFG
jgi:hypothetical protein